MIRAITLHSLIYISGLVAGKGLGLLIFILFARMLGPSAFGTYLLFVTYVQLATFIGDFGLQQWYQKHTSAQLDTQLFAQIFITRLTTLAVAIGLLFCFFVLYPQFDPVINVFLLFTLFFEAMISLSDGYYIEHKKTFFLSLKNIGRLLIMGILFGTMVFTGYMLNLTQSIFLYMSSAGITAAWYLPWNTVSVIKKEATRTPILSILKGALPYATLIITSIAYSKGDSIAIKSLLGHAALGIYGTAYRYLEALSIVPQALSQLIFPLSAKQSGLKGKDVWILWVIFSGIGVICSLLLYAFADILIVSLIGSEYAAAVPIVKMLSVVVLLFFMNAPISAVVQSSSYIHVFLPFGISNTVLNIGLNILLLPVYGVVAAAWTMAFTELTGFLLNIYFIYRIYHRP